MFSNFKDFNTGILEDIAIITMGQSPKGNTYNEVGKGTVFYQGRAEFGSRFPTRRLYTTEPKRLASANDVLLSVRAPVGDINIAFEECCIGRGLCSIRSRQGYSSYLLYTLFTLKPYLEKFNGEGTVFGSINKKQLSTLPIVCFPDEQIRKFNVLTKPLDDLIRSNTKAIYRLIELRDCLLPKLMSGEIDVSSIKI